MTQQCRECEAKGLHPDPEFPADLLCDDCALPVYEQRVEDAQDELDALQEKIAYKEDSK